MLVKLPQGEIKCKPVSLQTTECMVGIEVLILYSCQLCFYLSQALSGLPNFMAVSTGDMFKEASVQLSWAFAPPHRIYLAPSIPQSLCGLYELGGRSG